MLAQAGAEVVQGDNEDRAALEAALKGVYGVFSVQNNWLPNVGLEGEVRQGQLIADAAKAAQVRHFVYTSVGGAERNTGIPHFESKWQIEQYIHALGLRATVLRPVAFMENYNWSRPAILSGTLASIGLRLDKVQQMIAVDDIGALAALAFERPEEFIGRAIEIAGDELTEPQIVETFSRVIGRPIQLGQMPFDPNQQPDPEFLKMFQRNNDHDFDVHQQFLAAAAQAFSDISRRAGDLAHWDVAASHRAKLGGVGIDRLDGRRDHLKAGGYAPALRWSPIIRNRLITCGLSAPSPTVATPRCTLVARTVAVSLLMISLRSSHG